MRRNTVKLSFNLFDDGTKVCLSCTRRCKPSEMFMHYDYFGICSKCEKLLKPVPPDSPFEGTGNVDYLVSAYYYNKTMRRLAHKYKFGGNWIFKKFFSDMLYDYLKDSPFLGDFDFMTSVPLSYNREQQRGYNQSDMIAQLLCEKLSIPYVKCVYRAKNTMPQSTLQSIYRRLNIKDAFVADREKVEGKRILLLDDIFTTGSTMESCAKELKSKGCKNVAGIALSIVRYD